MHIDSPPSSALVYTGINELVGFFNQLRIFAFVLATVSEDVVKSTVTDAPEKSADVPVTTPKKPKATKTKTNKCFVTNGHFRLIYIDVTGNEGGQELYHPDGQKRLFKTITREFNPNDVMLDGKEEISDDVNDKAIDVPFTSHIDPEAREDLKELIEASKQIKISIGNEYRQQMLKYYNGLSRPISDDNMTIALLTKIKNE